MAGRGRRNYNWLILLIILIVIGCIIGGIISFVKGDKETNEEIISEQAAVSVVQQMILKDFEGNYPPTPKEVVRYHAELTKVLYNESYTEEEFVQLALKALILYDTQFATHKDEADYLADLKQEIVTYHNNQWSIDSYVLSNSEDVDYITRDGLDMAQLFCKYKIKKNTGSSSINQSILLRKNEEGQYKIMGWKLALDEEP